MEDNNGVESGKLLADDAEVETDDDGVEEYAELQDEEGSNLLTEDALRLRGITGKEGVRLDVDGVLGVAMRAVSASGRGRRSLRNRILGILVARVKELVTGMGVMANGGMLARRGMAVIMRLRSVAVISGVGAVSGVAGASGDNLLDADIGLALVLVLDVPLSTVVQEEDEHDGSHGDGGRPGVSIPALGHADARGGADLLVGGVKKVDKSRSDDDAGTEVASEEVDIARNAQARNASSKNREESGQRRSGQDDEQGRDAKADTTIVVVRRGIHVADHSARVGSLKIDAVGIEGHGGRGGDNVGRHVCQLTL